MLVSLEDGTTFEIQQRITESALETCPTTGQPVTRLITGGTGLIFKGSGFYLTDYARKNGQNLPATTSKSKDSGTPKAEKSETKTESTAKETKA